MRLNMEAAALALQAELDSLAQRYLLTPLELVAVVSHELTRRLEEEAADDRLAVNIMQDLSGPGPETESTMDAIRRGAAEFSATAPLPCHVCQKPKGQPPDGCPGHYLGTTTEPLNLNPMCCRKHNMMGRVRGNCAGGGVGSVKPARTGLTELTPEGPAGYAPTGEPGELE